MSFFYMIWDITTNKYLYQDVLKWLEFYITSLSFFRPSGKKISQGTVQKTLLGMEALDGGPDFIFHMRWAAHILRIFQGGQVLKFDQIYTNYLKKIEIAQIWL